MSLLNNLRVNIGDDDEVNFSSGIAPPTQQVQNISESLYSLMRDIRVNTGDDGEVNFASGVVIASGSTVSILGNDILNLMRDLRVDTGDDENVVYPSGSGNILPSVSVVGPSIALLLRDFRVDIGDDDNVNFGEISGVPVEPECPEVWCSTFVSANSYNTTPRDVIIFVNPVVSAPTTINLSHTPILGQLIIIKDLKGDARTNNIVVNPAPYLIDGLTAFHLSENKQSIMITWSGSEWNIV